MASRNWPAKMTMMESIVGSNAAIPFVETAAAIAPVHQHVCSWIRLIVATLVAMRQDKPLAAVARAPTVAADVTAAVEKGRPLSRG